MKQGDGPLRAHLFAEPGDFGKADRMIDRLVRPQSAATQSHHSHADVTGFLTDNDTASIGKDRLYNGCVRQMIIGTDQKIGRAAQGRNHGREDLGRPAAV